MYYRVKDDERLVRDSTNNSILNTDVKVLKKHEIIMRDKENAKKFAEEITNMKSDISELKEMLRLLINREK
jgi:hypothetical protein